MVHMDGKEFGQKWVQNLKRSELREELFKIIFYLELKKDNIENLITTFIEEKDPYKDEIDHVREISADLLGKMDEIDASIKTYLRDWSFERLSKMSIAVLRLAFYEIKYREDIPVKVSINEAMELAKKYDDEKNASFINGVLAEFVKEQ